MVSELSASGQKVRKGAPQRSAAERGAHGGLLGVGFDGEPGIASFFGSIHRF